MSDILHSLIWGTVILGVVFSIVFGVNSCNQQESDIRTACIKSGGMVIKRGETSSDCLRGTTTSPQ